MERILVAVDGSEHAERALDLACDLAKAHGGSLLLVNVIGDRPPTADERRLAEIEFSSEIRRMPDLAPMLEAGGQLENLVPSVQERYYTAASTARHGMSEGLLNDYASRAKDRGIAAVDSLVLEGDPADQVLRIAKDRKADLIVMGSRGVSDLRGLLMGSVSHKVCHLADCSCVIVK